VSKAPAVAPPTDEQLRLAFRQVRRPGWPSTLEEALARPVYALAIQGIARCLGRAAPTTGTRAYTHTTPPAPPARHKPAAFDRKRAAANDRD
jgi:hypothetical protein